MANNADRRKKGIEATIRTNRRIKQFNKLFINKIIYAYENTEKIKDGTILSVACL